jgi:hypothetical protein
MKPIMATIGLTVAVGASAAGQGSGTYVGTVSESMCKTDHKAMKIQPDAKCIQECVKASNDIHYVLISGNDRVYTLDDRERPARFAGQKVEISGVLDQKTSVLKIGSIRTARRP